MSDERTQTVTVPPEPPAPPDVGTMAAPPPGGRGRRWLIAGIVAIVVIGGAAFAAVRMLSDPKEDQAIRLVPTNAAVYGNIFFDPSRSQKRAIRDILEKFPDAGTPEEARDKIIELIDKGLKEQGFTFADDIEPWLGDQVAGFVTFPSDVQDPEQVPGALLLVGAKDTDAARSFLDDVTAKVEKEDVTVDEISFRGVDYVRLPEQQVVYGVVESFVAFGTERGLRQALRTVENGRTLEDSETYRDATERLAEDRLALFFFNPKPFMEAAQAAGVPGAAGTGLFGAASEPAAAIAYARSDGLVFESAGAIKGPFADLARAAAGDPGLMPELPRDSWVAYQIVQSGRSLRTLLDALAESGVPIGFATGFLENELRLDIERDFLSWMGDLAFFVQGTNERTLGGGLVIETTKPERSTATVRRIAGLLRGTGVPVKIDARSFSFQEVGMPEPIFVVAERDRVVAAYGNRAVSGALGRGARLSSSGAFQRAQAALGDDFTVNGYVDVQAILDLADSFGALRDPVYAEEVRPNLDPLSHLVFGSQLERDLLYQRLVIGVE